MSPLVGARILAGILMCGGVFALTMAIRNVEWFFRSPNVKAFTGRISRTKARIIYGILGLSIIIVSVYLLTYEGEYTVG